MSAIKTGCIVQGDMRRGTNETLAVLADHFDILILSTWKQDEPKVPDGNFDLILNDVPPCKGQAHRNYQRTGVDAGLKLAEKLGCNYVLKWRTDMMPTKFDVGKMLKMSHYNISDGVPSRIVMCDFRNLTINPDWFSTIPDFFAFGHIDMIKMLWSAEGFDFLKPINPPKDMIKDLYGQWDYKDPRLFPPEAELYANFKSRLMKKTNRSLNHISIAREYLYLVDYRKFGICWFAPDRGFRPIGVTYRYPWWTESVWKGKRPVIDIPGPPSTKYLWEKVSNKLRKFSKKRDCLEQHIWLSKYRGEKISLLKKTSQTIGCCWLNILSGLLMKLWRTVQLYTKFR